MRRINAPRIAACTGAAIVLAGCGTPTMRSDALLGMISPYRIDIQQGNVVTSEQMARLKTGMTRLQVRDIMGTPLLNDAFHVNRWDYVFSLAQPGKPLQRRDVVLRFNGDILQSIDGPELPSEREFIASIARFSVASSSPDLELSAEQLKNLPIPSKTAPLPPANDVPNPIPSTRTFPPLELF
jgi:outer membrane protein assembly factor BamE